MNLRLPTISPNDDKPLSGRAVLTMLLAFFGTVIVVNLFMVNAAITTFGGVDTPSSYEAGLAYKAEEAAVATQQALGLSVTAKLSAVAGGQTVTIEVRDRDGRPVTGATTTATLAHPIDERRDIAGPRHGGGWWRLQG